MEEPTDLAAELQRLQQRWDTTTERPESPRSTMDVIEYGLGDQQRAEVYLNRLLCYLLDPAQPHQLGTDFLTALLAGLPTAAAFNEDTYDLTDVRVNQQVPVWETGDDDRDDDATPGYLDLVLDVPHEWCLLVELKFSAPETGTEFYCNAAQIGEHSVADYGSGQYHVYLHQDDRPEATGECFVNWTWQAFVDDVLEPFLATHTPRYPQRTVAQLYDLRDDINRIAGMSDQSDIDHEKVELYLDHAEAITDVTETFDSEWAAYSTRWGEAMQGSLDHEQVIVTDFDDGIPVVSIDRGSASPEQWYLNNSGGDWQHVFKHGWRRREHEPVVLTRRADDRNDVRIGFYHRMEDNRPLAVTENDLRFNFRCMGSNPSAFTEIYKDHFDAHRSEIETHLESTKATITDDKLTLITGTYPIDVDGHETFFDAYTAALNTAFTELVIDQPELIALFTDLFDESIAEYRDDS